MQKMQKGKLPTWEEVVAKAKAIRFEPYVFRPEIFCGTTEDYEKQPVRALFDLLMFFDSEGNKIKEFCGRPLKRIPAHILPFIISRLIRFTNEKKRCSL
ncbi:MAG: hypothetical protein EOP50_14725, partial [Sphingobacteriales bacterium]